MLNDVLFSRRDLLTRCGAGFGMIGLANVLAAQAPANPLAPGCRTIRPGRNTSSIFT